ncbi:MAG: hypothetical protein ACI9LM_003126 [Alteromonadaceae bacterium]|jgi:hypothetical protein
MLMKNNISRRLALSSLITMVLSSEAVFAETVASSASVVVQNSFTLVETTPLSFGTVVAIAENNSSVTNDNATLVVSPNPATADVITNGTLAKLTPIVASTEATFTISGAAPNTALNITLPNAFDLTDPSLTDTKDFKITAPTSFVTTSGTAFTFDTDGTGNMVFNMGATLSTDTTLAIGAGAIPYSNVTFTGTYTMTVNY